MPTAKKFILTKHFDGFPKLTDLSLIEEELPPITDGEFLAEAVFISVDPHLRAYEPFVEEGSDFRGTQVALVTDSKNSKFPVGKHILGHFGWRTHTISDGSGESYKGFGPPQIISDIGSLPLSLALGVLGRPGNSAYFGLLEICQPKFGETVVVTGAAGAVGNHVGQIAKIKGCKVIGVTGDDIKGKWLVEELGFDHYINYKNKDFAKTLTQYAPNGIDCFFDNVGGEISSLILHQMNDFGRIAVCGAISAYNSDIANLPKAILIQGFLVMKQLKMEGFLIKRFEKRWPEAIHQNIEWIHQGKLKYKETITEGFENTFQAFIDMLQGVNVGKAIVKV